jgi:predicted Holliday junction resolvase-like endonuclease
MHNIDDTVTGPFDVLLLVGMVLFGVILLIVFLIFLIRANNKTDYYQNLPARLQSHERKEEITTQQKDELLSLAQEKKSKEKIEAKLDEILSVK